MIGGGGSPISAPSSKQTAPVNGSEDCTGNGRRSDPPLLSHPPPRPGPISWILTQEKAASLVPAVPSIIGNGKFYLS
ncbi:hypothetical protein CEXT_114691 [Caerostris extrusa]|uniref:Uncharacterized protein n=1 Tax=Caerostris extrusa TaxID=172846 RepID=A0AAV4X7S2_CAEEX|nr:hypothetical protein CEXT_114691 [Caerostris extrusa]